MTKICPACGITQPLAAFYVEPRLRSGHAKICRQCSNAASSARRARLGDQHRADKRAWAMAHPEATAAQKRAQAERLNAGYVRNLLAKRSGLSAADIPPQLVELKRQQIALKRLSAAIKTELEST